MFKKEKMCWKLKKEFTFTKFDNDGLIPVITMCSQTKEILMHGYMNIEALKKTIETKKLTITVDQEKLSGIKVKQVVLYKK